MLSFDITDKHIRVIKGSEANGKIKVQSATTIDLEEPIIENGVVNEIAKLANLISIELKNRRLVDKEAIISISSNLIVFKELFVPKAKPDQLISMIQNQMQQSMGLTDDFSISYTITGETQVEGASAYRVLATACPRNLVDCYRKLFNLMGVQLKAVNVSCNCITRIITADPRNKSRMPLLVVQIDKDFVSINLYEDGQLSFSRYVTIDPADYGNSENYVFEAVTENIYRMLQFHRSKGDVLPVQNVIFYGDVNDFIKLTNALEQFDIQTHILGVPNQIYGYENFEFTMYANAIGALYRRKKTTERINLLEVDSQMGREAASSSFAMQIILTFIATSAIIGAGFAFLSYQNSQYIDKAEKEQKYIDSVQPDLIATREKLKTIEGLRKELIASEALINAFNSKPNVTSEIYNNIVDCFEKDVKIKNISYSDGVVNLSLIATSQKSPAKTVDKLFKIDEAAAIGYGGYNGEEGAEISFTVTITLKGNEVKVGE